jgi:hypothetical protein
LRSENGTVPKLKKYAGGAFSDRKYYYRKYFIRKNFKLHGILEKMFDFTHKLTNFRGYSGFHQLTNLSRLKLILSMIKNTRGSFITAKIFTANILIPQVRQFFFFFIWAMMVYLSIYFSLAVGNA